MEQTARQDGNGSNGDAPVADATEKIDRREALSLYGPKPPVTRISRKAVAVAGLLAAGLGALVLVRGLGSRHNAPRDAFADQNAIRPAPSVIESGVRELPKDYTFDVRKEAEQIGYEAPATRPAGPTAEELAVIEERRRLAQVRQRMLEEQRKELEKALDSPLVFSGAKGERDAGAAVAMTPTTADPRGSAGVLQATPSQLPPPAPGVAGTSELQPPAFRPSSRQEKESFLTEAAQVEPYLNKPLLDPISKYGLKAGTLIPGALVTAINTDLPGEVIGQVTENVYDTVRGKHLLIPQGSRLLGKYQSLVSNGQNRALLVWRRLILPNGKSIVLDGMPGTDQAGQAGLRDRVDYHLDKLAGATALTTAIAYAGNLARNRDGGGRYGDRGGDVVGDTVAQQANRVGDKIIDRELDVQPTITVRAGWPMRVLVNKDIVLAPYQAE